ncbi:MAG: hypothetical protein JSR46_05350, partial [Verrucomicrobia bacterium]|nr:hypothetical protein [Verrucomicrobiota bacterium]
MCIRLNALLLFCLLFAPLFGQVSISVHQDKSALLIDQTMELEYTISFPRSYEPDLFAFFYQQSLMPQGKFRIVSTQVKQQNKKGEKELQLTFELAPKATGQCIFAPGLLTFGSHRAFLLPAVEADCIETTSSAHMLPPLLPFRPETKIQLDPYTRALVDSTKRQVEEENRIVTRYERYKGAWNLLNALLLSLAGGALLLWCA